MSLTTPDFAGAWADGSVPNRDFERSPDDADDRRVGLLAASAAASRARRDRLHGTSVAVPGSGFSLWSASRRGLIMMRDHL